MVGKLFKHEFKDLFKKSIFIFLIFIGFSSSVILLRNFSDNNDVINRFISIFIIGYVLSLAGMLIYSFFYPIYRFYKSMLKDEGYLTHTLPVTKAQLMFTKLTTSFLLFAVSMALFILSLYFVFDLNIIELISSLLSNYKNTNIMLILYVIAYYFSVIMLVITAMVIGHSMPSKKISKSIITGIIMYFIYQVIYTILTVVLLLIFKNEIDENSLGNAIYYVLLVPTIVNFVLSSVEVVITHHYLSKKLNLE